MTENRPLLIRYLPVNLILPLHIEVPNDDHFKIVLEYIKQHGSPSQPLIVMEVNESMWIVKAGQEDLAACRMLGISQIPCVVFMPYYKTRKQIEFCRQLQQIRKEEGKES